MRSAKLGEFQHLRAEPDYNANSSLGRTLGWWALATAIILALLVLHEPRQPLPVSLLLAQQQAGADGCATLQWDVGAGFNAFEAKRVCPPPAASAGGQNPAGAAGNAEPAASGARTISLPQKRLLAFRLSSEHGALGISEITVAVAGEPRWSMSTDPTLSVIVSPPGLATALDQGVVSWRLILFQAIAAGLGGAALIGAMTGLRIASRALRRTLFPALMAQHWLFSLIFVVCAAHYLTWVLGQWPGFPTGDTLNQIQQRIDLSFENLNPFVFTLLLNSVIELTTSLGFFTLAQAIATAALGAYGFAALKRDGCPGWVVVLFALLFAASPVIAIYNLQPWRDITFGLLVVWWMLFIFRRALRRQRGCPVFADNRTAIFGLGALLFLVSTVRYNGLVFLIVIPALLAFGKIMSRRAALAVAAVALIWTAVFIGPVALVMGVHRNTDYNIMRFALSANTVIGIMRTDAYRTQSPEHDRQTVSAVADYDALKRAYSPTSALPLLDVPRKVSLQSPQFEALQRLHRRLVFDNPHIFLADRTYLFLSTIGFRTWGWASALWMPGRPERVLSDRFFDDASDLRRAPVTAMFGEWQSAVLASVWRGPGWLDGYVLYFSAFIPFCLMLAVFLLARWLPLTALASLVPASQVAAIYLTTFASDFRFVYFLYLYGFFALPMMFTEWRGKAAFRASEPVLPAPA